MLHIIHKLCTMFEFIIETRRDRVFYIRSLDQMIYIFEVRNKALESLQMSTVRPLDKEWFLR